MPQIAQVIALARSTAYAIRKRAVHALRVKLGEEHGDAFDDLGT